ncbi:MAG: helix-turn-helix domain-containing protein, partial [Eubacteriales bacterium]|nr:helix-turn-helix domain-containing protein [Eubacteriales bacterium]
TDKTEGFYWENLIAGAQLHDCGDVPGTPYALLRDVPSNSSYRCMLTFADNYIYFRDHTVFQALDEINYMFTVYRRWEQALKQLNLVYCDLSALLDLSYEIIPCPLAVYQNGERLAASSRYQAAIDDFERGLRDGLMQTPYPAIRLGREEDPLPADGRPILIHSSLHGGKQVILGTIRLSEQPIRFLALSNGSPISIGDVHFAHILMQALLCNLSLWKQRIISKETSFFVALLRDEPPQIRAEELLQRLRWKADHRFTVFWLERRDGGDSILLDRLFADLRRQFPAAFVLAYRDAILLICDLDRMEHTPTESDFAPLRTQFVIGQSNISGDFALIAQLMQQARSTMQQARQQNGFFLAAERIMLDHMHQVFRQDAMLCSLVHPAVRALMEQDAAQHTQLLHTLHVFLFYGGNCNAAAKALRLHRNSLVNRLEHISALTHIDLDDILERETLLLSLFIADPLLSEKTAIPSHPSG